MKSPNKSRYVSIMCKRCGKFKLEYEFTQPDIRVCTECFATKVLDVTVRPRRLPVTGCGTWPEFFLMDKGFNELPSIKQYGVIVTAYNTGEIEIYWPHIDAKTFMFPDEVEFPWEKK